MEKHPDYLLVLIGFSSEDFNDGGQNLAFLTEQLILDRKVLHNDYLEEKDLIAFYQGAFCLTYPTIYEGFGLPAIEAMACGVPVIIPKTQSVEEILARAAKVVEPLNEENLADAIKAIFESQDFRVELSKK